MEDKNIPVEENKAQTGELAPAPTKQQVSKREKGLITAILIVTIVIAAVAVIGFLRINPRPTGCRDRPMPRRYAYPASCRAAWCPSMSPKVSMYMPATPWYVSIPL